MTRLIEDRLVSEQVSMFLQPGLVVTFQETPGDVWDPIRARIADASMRVRRHDASFLIYALIDAIVDHGFPILERYGELIEAMESAVLDAQPRELLQRIHAIKREMTQLRRTIWPTREVVVTLMQENTPYITAETRTYLRDVYEHTVQLVEIVELYREMASGLSDLFLSAISNRTNQIIKVLTIMASLFIPTTFLAGVYGMNFEHQPEFAWRYGYHMFWAIALTVIFGLLAYFWRKGWIGRG
jgi:magnesium transporter